MEKEHGYWPFKCEKPLSCRLLHQAQAGGSGPGTGALPPAVTVTTQGTAWGRRWGRVGWGAGEALAGPSQLTFLCPPAGPSRFPLSLCSPCCLITSHPCPLRMLHVIPHRPAGPPRERSCALRSPLEIASGDQEGARLGSPRSFLGFARAIRGLDCSLTLYLAFGCAIGCGKWCGEGDISKMEGL